MNTELSSASALRRAAASAGVWLIFAAMLLGISAFVARFGTSVPLVDDFTLVPQATGREPVTWKWLWAIYNDHRVFLVKLVLALLMRATHCDCRYGMFLNVALLAGSVALQLAVLRRIRGSTSWVDACLPLVWLSWSNYQNLLLAWGLALTLSTALVGSMVAVIAVRPEALGPARALFVGACCLALPLTGSHGWLSTPPFVAYLLALGATGVRSRDVTRRRAARLALGLAAVASLLLYVYVIGFEMSTGRPLIRDSARIAQVALRFLTNEFGQLSVRSWPWSGVAAVVVVLATGARLVASIRADPRERWRAAGLLACLVSVVGLALGLGVGRGATTEAAGFAPRYVSLPFPLLSIVLMTWVALGSVLVERVLGTCLVIVAIWSLELNRALALNNGRRHRSAEAALRNDVRKGWSSWRLAVVHVGPLLRRPAQTRPPEWLARQLHSLRSSRIDPFREVTWSDDVEQEWIQPCDMFATQPSLVTPGSVVFARWIGERRVLASNHDSKIVFDLAPGAQLVRGELGWIGDASNDQRPNGFVDFHLRHVSGDGPPTSLLERRLAVTSAPTPIFEPFSIELPAAAAGELQLLIRIPAGADARIGTAFWAAVEVR